MKTLGQFYREKILDRNDLSPREFLDYRGECKIERDLFGWKLYSGKNYIDCRSHEEAKLLKIYLEAGMDTVMIPADDNYLKTIVPELEKMKNRIDKIIGIYADGVLNRRLKEQLRREVYLELLK
jgi:hypothetical protein